MEDFQTLDEMLAEIGVKKDMELLKKILTPEELAEHIAECEENVRRNREQSV